MCYLCKMIKLSKHQLKVINFDTPISIGTINNAPVPCNNCYTVIQNNHPIPYYNPVSVSNNTSETYGVYNNITHYFFAKCNSLTDSFSFNDCFAMGKIEKIPLTIMVCNSTKLDGTPRKLLEVSKLNNLGWKAEMDLQKGIESTSKWFMER